MLYLLYAVTFVPMIMSGSSCNQAMEELNQSIAGNSTYSELVNTVDALTDELRVACLLNNESLSANLQNIIQELQIQLQDAYAQAYGDTPSTNSHALACKAHWTCAALASSLMLGLYSWAKPEDAAGSLKLYKNFTEAAQDWIHKGGDVLRSVSEKHGGTSGRRITTTTVTYPKHLNPEHAALAYQQSERAIQDASTAIDHGAKDTLKTVLTLATLVTGMGALACWLNSACPPKDTTARTIARYELVIQRLTGWLQSLEQFQAEAGINLNVH